MSSHSDAYQKFRDIMTHLEMRRVEIVTRITNTIDGARLEELRKKLKSRKK